ncbi:MAG: hypothetical protein WC792_04945 [Candidatus Micrarchaeia archaeon]|jgi:hypothetical protein
MAREYYNGNRDTHVRKVELVAHGVPRPGSESERVRNAFVKAFEAEFSDRQEATTHRANWMLLEGKKLTRGKLPKDERDLVTYYRRIVGRHPEARQITEEKRAEMVAEFLPQHLPQVAKQFKPDEVKAILRELAKNMPAEDVARALPSVGAKLASTRSSLKTDKIAEKYKRFKLLAAVIGAIAIPGSLAGGYALGAKSSHAQEAKPAGIEQTQTGQRETETQTTRTAEQKPDQQVLFEGLSKKGHTAAFTPELGEATQRSDMVESFVVAGNAKLLKDEQLRAAVLDQAEKELAIWKTMGTLPDVNAAAGTNERRLAELEAQVKAVRLAEGLYSEEEMATIGKTVGKSVTDNLSQGTGSWLEAKLKAVKEYR